MMDEKFFEKILGWGLDDDTIRNVKIKKRVPAVGKGENFLSQMWRFTLEYSCCEKAIRVDDELSNSIKMAKEKEREIRLIVKCEPSIEGPGLDLIKKQSVFETEAKMLKMILPEMERLVGQRLAPKCFYASQKHSLVALEDLQPLGFKTKDRQAGLSMDHVLMVLENLAKFHAASVYQCERNPDLIKSFKAGIMTENTPKNMLRVIEKTLEMVVDKLRQWPEPEYHKISEKLFALIDKFSEEIVSVTDYVDTEFCVLNHGDCWVNNLMFREDSQGKPLQVMLIDYQMSVYSSPVIDLIYFLSVCPSIELKTDKDDFFLNKYLDTLTRTMSSLGCKTQPPTIEALERAMLKRRMWLVMSAVAFYPRMIADLNEIESFDEILVSGETKMNIFKNPNATIALKKVLSVMEKKGYLD